MGESVFKRSAVVAESAEVRIWCLVYNGGFNLAPAFADCLIFAGDVSACVAMSADKRENGVGAVSAGSSQKKLKPFDYGIMRQRAGPSDGRGTRPHLR